VSLYNETDGQGILPTPTIGAVGLIGTPDALISGLPSDGDIAVVIGVNHGHLGQSALLAEAFGREDGDAPHVDLEAERANGTFVRENGPLIAAASDLSDGGLGLAAFEMADAASIGISLSTADTAQLFGEDQARYLLAINPSNLNDLMAKAQSAGITASNLGTFGGTDVTFADASAPLGTLSQVYRSAFAEKIT